MAATRLIPLHAGKGRTVAQSLGDRTDYAKNPEKTEKGELVTAYGCDPFTVDEEFLLQKRTYEQIHGRRGNDSIIAYQIRQSFKPEEITPEEANRLGHELAMRFTKGRYSFIVDLICLENGLSVISPRPYSERPNRAKYVKRETVRETICADIDAALAGRPKDFKDFIKSMEKAGYEVKQGKHPAVKGKGQQRFIRLSSLPEGYREEDIRAAISGERISERKAGSPVRAERSVNLLIDIQSKMREKGAGYARWATVYNLKQISKTLLFLRDHKIDSLEQLQAIALEKAAKRDELLSSIRASEKRLAEIASLKKHIINYSKTRATYEAYRKAGYSKNFFEAHREEITLHKAAKQAFNELGVRKIPKVKELSAEYAELLSGKKAAYAEYRKVRDEAQELAIAERNIASLYEAESREQERQKEEKSH